MSMTPVPHDNSALIPLIAFFATLNVADTNPAAFFTNGLVMILFVVSLIVDALILFSTYLFALDT